MGALFKRYTMNSFDDIQQSPSQFAAEIVSHLSGDLVEFADGDSKLRLCEDNEHVHAIALHKLKAEIGNAEISSKFGLKVRNALQEILEDADLAVMNRQALRKILKKQFGGRISGP